MLAVSFDRGAARLVETPRPEPGRDEALVRVLMAGICGTDLELLGGYAGFSGQPGHEFVGLVARADSRPELEGRRVVADINFGCGSCGWCRQGLERHCPERRVLGVRGWSGAFAEYIRLPARKLYAVPETVPDREAVLTEPLAAALRVLHQIRLSPALSLAVLGDGRLGLLSGLALGRLLPQVMVIGKHASKLERVSRQGIRTCRLEHGLSRAEVLERTGRFDVVIEATGRPEGLGLALDLAQPGGTIVLKSTSLSRPELDTAAIAVKELRLLGSRCGDMAQALLLLEGGCLDLAPLIDAVYPLRDAAAALDHAGREGALKVLLAVSPEDA